MSKIVLIISCFEKAQEMNKFYQSIEDSDIPYIPRISIINTDPENDLTGEQSISVARRFQRPGDRVFVSHQNLYMSSYRYVIQKYATGYDFMIGTEADIWFEKPFQFGDSIKYIQRYTNVAMIACLSRYESEWQNKCQFKDIELWKQVDEYLDAPRNVPWHMCLTRIPYMINYFKNGFELIDHPFTDYCRKYLKRKVLTLDCRSFCVHLDYHATIKRYPYYAKLCGVQHFNIKQRSVEDGDIEEI